MIWSPILAEAVRGAAQEAHGVGLQAGPRLRG